jgi:proton-dependent oligopeptide transporter, POT family
VAVFKIVSVFVFVAMFWAVYDQKVTTWAFQAERMELRLWPGSGPTVEADQTIAINPFLVMLLIPLLDVAYRGLGRLGITVSPLRRMAVGMFIAALAFVATAAVQSAIDRLGPGRVWIGWQLPQYLLLTTAEVMVSVTGLEFAYTQAPRRMKSTVMGFWLLTSAAGNVLVVLLLPLLPDSKTPEYLLAWAGLMAVTALLFVARAAFYVPKDYTQK